LLGLHQKIYRKQFNYKNTPAYKMVM